MCHAPGSNKCSPGIFMPITKIILKATHKNKGEHSK